MQTPFTTLITTSILTLITVSPTLSAERSYEFEPFNQIEASQGIQVVITTGDERLVSVEAKSEDDFTHLELSVENGTLFASQDYNLLDFILNGGLLRQFFANSPPIKVSITLPELEILQASSGAQVDLYNMTGSSLRVNASSGAEITLNEISVENVSLTASSGADIVADGTCVSVGGNASSGADIHADALECATGQANASSGGHFSLFVSDTVDANASSGASISISGEPEQVSSNSSSGGDVYLKN